MRMLVGAVLVAGLTLSPMVKSGASEATVPVVKVWTEPASGYGFLDAAIASARRSIDLSMYELSDPTIEHDLVARAATGVDVRVILDADYSGMSENASAYAELHASKVHVEWVPRRTRSSTRSIWSLTDESPTSAPATCSRTTTPRRGTAGSRSRARAMSAPSLVPSGLISRVRT